MAEIAVEQTFEEKLALEERLRAFYAGWDDDMVRAKCAALHVRVVQQDRIIKALLEQYGRMASVSTAAMERADGRCYSITHGVCGERRLRLEELYTAKADPDDLGIPADLPEGAAEPAPERMWEGAGG